MFLHNSFFIPSEVFCNKNRTVLGEKDILRFPKLAETMETIAQQGANAFYTGKIGQDLIEDIKAAGWFNFNTCCASCIGVYMKNKHTCI